MTDLLAALWLLVSVLWLFVAVELTVRDRRRRRAAADALQTELRRIAETMYGRSIDAVFRELIRAIERATRD